MKKSFFVHAKSSFLSLNDTEWEERCTVLIIIIYIFIKKNYIYISMFKRCNGPGNISLRDGVSFDDMFLLPKNGR